MCRANAEYMSGVVTVEVVCSLHPFFSGYERNLLKIGSKLSLTGLLFIFLLPYPLAINPYGVLSEKIQEWVLLKQGRNPIRLGQGSLANFLKPIFLQILMAPLGKAAKVINL